MSLQRKDYCFFALPVLTTVPPGHTSQYNQGLPVSSSASALSEPLIAANARIGSQTTTIRATKQLTFIFLSNHEHSTIGSKEWDFVNWLLLKLQHPQRDPCPTLQFWVKFETWIRISEMEWLTVASILVKPATLETQWALRATGFYWAL